MTERIENALATGRASDVDAEDIDYLLDTITALTERAERAERELAATRQERDTEADAVTDQRETIKRLRAELAEAKKQIGEMFGAGLRYARERDARPEISPEDAALTSCSLVHRIGYSQAEWDACLRIENALRAHAARAASEASGDDVVLDMSSRDVTLTLPVGGRIVDVDASSNPPVIRIKVPPISPEPGRCEACEGTGWVTWADRCEECNGTGRKGER